MKLNDLIKVCFVLTILFLTFSFFSCINEDNSALKMEEILSEPHINFPQNNEIIGNLQPILSVSSSSANSEKCLMYDFQIFDDANLTKLITYKNNVKQGSTLFAEKQISEFEIGNPSNSNSAVWQISANLKTGKQYWWRARCHHRNFFSQWMPAVTFTITETVIPELISPAFGEIICDLKQDFIVETPAFKSFDRLHFGNNTLLNLQIFSANGLNDLIIDIKNFPANSEITSIPLPHELQDKTKLWWRISQKSSSSITVWSNPQPFLAQAIDEVTIVSPKNGALVRAENPELIVKNPRNNCNFDISFDFEIFDNSELTVPLFSSQTVPKGEYELTSWVVPNDLPQNKQLFWRCKVTSNNYQSKWSETAVFSIDISHAATADQFAKEVSNCSTTCPYSLAYDDCNEALGEPNFWADNNNGNITYHGFVSLGIRGTIILDMGEGTEIVDGEGADIKIFQAVSVEEFSVQVAEHASGPFYDLGHAGTGWFQGDDPFFAPPDSIYPFQRNNSDCYTTAWIRDNINVGEIGWCDISSTGLEKVRFVRIKDEQPWGDLRKDCFWMDEYTGEWIPYKSAGADIDAVKARNM